MHLHACSTGDMPQCVTIFSHLYACYPQAPFRTPTVSFWYILLMHAVAVFCRVFQCGAECCSVLQYVAVYRSAFTTLCVSSTGAILHSDSQFLLSHTSLSRAPVLSSWTPGSWLATHLHPTVAEILCEGWVMNSRACTTAGGPNTRLLTRSEFHIWIHELCHMWIDVLHLNKSRRHTWMSYVIYVYMYTYLYVLYMWTNICKIGHTHTQTANQRTLLKAARR